MVLLLCILAWRHLERSDMGGTLTAVKSQEILELTETVASI